MAFNARCLANEPDSLFQGEKVSPVVGGKKPPPHAQDGGGDGSLVSNDRGDLVAHSSHGALKGIFAPSATPDVADCGAFFSVERLLLLPEAPDKNLHEPQCRLGWLTRSESGLP